MRSPLKQDAFGRIAALAMLGIAGVWLVYDLVDAVRYFSQDYQRLRWVGLAVMVGAPALLISQMHRLEPSCDRDCRITCGRVLLWTLGRPCVAVDY
jgi:hypothetical protein